MPVPSWSLLSSEKNMKQTNRSIIPEYKFYERRKPVAVKENNFRGGGPTLDWVFRPRMLTCKHKASACKNAVKSIPGRRNSRCKSHKMGRVWCVKHSKRGPAAWGKEKEGLLTHDEIQEVDRGQFLLTKEKIFYSKYYGKPLKTFRW